MACFRANLTFTFVSYFYGLTKEYMLLMQGGCSVKTVEKVTGGVTAQVKNSSLVKSALSNNTATTRWEENL
jgi:hypothetical protein